MDCAASCNHLVFVYSLASSSDTFAEETADLQRELKSASARQERILRPSNDVEIYNIVKQRMFVSISSEAAEKAADTYFETFRASRIDLPDTCKELSYREAIANSYPFHPELFNLLTHKIASIPDFQRTRGALRLFAQVIRYLWNQGMGYLPLIHPHHFPVGIDSDMTSDLTSRLDRSLMDLPIRADIYNNTGTMALAQLHDQEWRDMGKSPFSSWVTRTIFLHSLTQGITAGIRRSELNLSLMTPYVEINFIEGVIKNLLAKAWHLDFDPITQIYQFKEEPSLNKIIAQEKAQVGSGEAKEELRKRRDSIFASKFFTCVADPEGAHQVDDRPDNVVLCLIDFNEETIRTSVNTAPKSIEQIFDNTGEAGKFRVFKNRLLFLLANEQALEQALNLTREYIAVKNLRQSPRHLEELSDTQQKELKGREGTLDLGVRIALTNTYSHLFYPATLEPVKAPKGLMHYTLPPQDNSTVKGKNNQQEVILKALKDCDKIRPDDAKPFAPAYVLQKVWPAGIDQWTTKALREAFAKNTSLNMLLEGEWSKLRETIAAGVNEGQWDLKSGAQVFIKQPNQPLSLPNIEFSDRLELYRRGILKPPEPKVIEFSVQVLPLSATEKTARLKWRAKGAISTALYKENELIEGNCAPNWDTEVAITATTQFRVVADYGDEGTGEQTTIAYYPSAGGGSGSFRDGDDDFDVGPLLDRPPIIERDGSVKRVFNDFADEVESKQIQTVSRLEITVEGIQDYRRLGTAIALLAKFKPQIDQNVTLSSNGQYTKLEFQGDIRGFQAFSSPLAALFNATGVQGNATLTIRIVFEQPIPATGGILGEIQNALGNNPVDRLRLTLEVGYGS
jgi:hypothetical protein